MQDELTEKMHSEFQIDPETEISHRVQSAKLLLSISGRDLSEILKIYGLTLEQYLKYE